MKIWDRICWAAIDSKIARGVATKISNKDRNSKYQLKYIIVKETINSEPTSTPNICSKQCSQ